jgi:hypothetical protein
MHDGEGWAGRRERGERGLSGSKWAGEQEGSVQPGRVDGDDDGGEHGSEDGGEHGSEDGSEVVSGS